MNMNFKTWSSGICQLFPTNGPVAVMAGIHAVLSNEVFEAAQCQPILAIYGPRASGKTEMSRCIAGLAGNPNEPGEITTLASRRQIETLLAINEGAACIEEITNAGRSLLELLKTTWDRIDLSVSAIDHGANVVRALPTFGTLVVNGLQFPEDHAFRSRCIELNLHVPDIDWDMQVLMWELLNADYEDARNEIRNAAVKVGDFTAVYMAHNDLLNGDLPLMDPRRLERNISTYRALHATLSDHLEFPFTGDALLNVLLDGARVQMESMNAVH